MNISSRLSRNIVLSNSFCILLVVIMHSITGYYNLGASFIFEAFIFNTFTRIAVPIFFTISGYLFSIDNRIWKEKIYRRSKTLLLPFILWNILVLILFYSFNFIPLISQFVNGYKTEIFTKLFTFSSLTYNPINAQFWFLRDLIILCLLYPILEKLIKYKITWILFIFSFILDFKFGCFFIDSILFFSIGIYLSRNNINNTGPVAKILSRNKIKISIAYIFVCFIATYAVCVYNIDAQILRKPSLIFGIIAYIDRKSVV